MLVPPNPNPPNLFYGEHDGIFRIDMKKHKIYFYSILFMKKHKIYFYSMLFMKNTNYTSILFMKKHKIYFYSILFMKKKHKKKACLIICSVVVY